MERREFLAVTGGVVMGATVRTTGGRAVGRSQTPTVGPQVFAQRIARAQDELKSRKLDLLVVEPSTNFQYFTGYNPGRSERLILLMIPARSEEHTSELQSRSDLVCRLLLEKKKNE